MGDIDLNFIEDIINRNIREHHRRIIVLEGEAHKYLDKIVDLYTSIRKNKYLLLLSGKEDRDESPWVESFVSTIKNHVDEGRIQWGYVPFKDLERIMGTTWDFLIADFRKDLRPNDLGRLIEVVRGGGLIIFLSPKREDWKNMIVPFHKDMVTDPFTEADLKPIFIRHLVESLEESEGIFFIDESGEIYGNTYEAPPLQRPEPIIPTGTTFHELVYKIALTQDQVDVIHAIDRISINGGSVVVTADRGRGKSAAIGLAIAGVMHRDARNSGEKMKVVLTSPEPVNVREVFNFIARALFRLKVKFSTKKRDGAIIELNSQLGQVKYVSPIDVFRERPDMLVVDEASGVPVGLLEGYAERYDLTIFSTTLHGYEGAGRGFQIRFLPLLRRYRGKRLIEIHMSQPIRYGELDPIERWLFKALFLDSDPAEFSEDKISKVAPKRTRYVKIDLEDWLFNRKDKLREFIGIYIYAHYRNRPNDIMILCDAPHHFARCLKYDGHVVNSLHLCYEGGMSEDGVRRTLAGAPPSGHLIPTVLIRYYPLYRDFAYLKGVRIVRIATHPMMMNRGIGSKALDHVVSEAKEMGVDWVGSSFGATEELLNFWIRNKFIPVYLSPIRNHVSGEFSTIVLRPLSSAGREYIKKFRVEFKKLFVESMVDAHFVLDEKLAYILLSADPWSISYSPNLRGNQRERLKEYIYGALHYGGAYDAIREIVKAHFIRSPDKRVPIPKKFEYALISKVLQARSWDKVSHESGIDRMDLIFKFREYIGKMRLKYLEGI